ncbi:MAG: ATP-binding cassette domain-containing protein [Acidimicrobiales bacterium]
MYVARDITKTYGHITALRGANFSIAAGELVAMIGDNGAGKSTFVRILSGAEAPNGGDLYFGGDRIHHDSIAGARARGIETVYQDLALAPHLTPTANLFLGREVRARGFLGRLGFLDERAMQATAQRRFAELGVRLPSLTSPVYQLSGGQRQGVAVARSVAWATKVLFMDEPTAALGVRQTRNVLDLARRVRDSGVAVTLISHNLPEVLTVADRIVILRAGRTVASLAAKDASVEQLVTIMNGLDSEGASQ